MLIPTQIADNVESIWSYAGIQKSVVLVYSATKDSFAWTRTKERLAICMQPAMTRQTSSKLIRKNDIYLCPSYAGLYY